MEMLVLESMILHFYQEGNNLKKNVVILFTDQQRFDSLGCNGNVHADTRNIDALANEGCNFTRHLVANSVCMPSRASFLSGMYVPGHGVSSNGIPLWRRDNGCEDPNDYIAKNIFGEGVPDKIPTIADYLLEEGYQTVLLGKLHAEPSLADKSYGFRSSYSAWEDPERENNKAPYYGFTYVKSVLGHGEAPCEYDHGHYGRWLHREHPEIVEAIKKRNENDKNTRPNMGMYLSKVPAEHHNSMWLANEACDYIDNHREKDKPMLMFVGFPDPHHDFTPPEDFAQRFLDIDVPELAKLECIEGGKPEGAMAFLKASNRSKEDREMAYRYTQASVSLVDKAVGKIVDKLKETGMYDDTIILFTSDHGEMLGDYEALYKTDQPFYSLIHTPLVLKPAKDTSVPKELTGPMSNVDVMPTVFAMLDIEKPKWAQGVNIFSEEAEGNMPMSTCYNLGGKNRNLSIYDENYRYTYVTDTGEEELYHQINDPFEYKNLANNPEYKALCAEMKLKVLEKHLECEHQLYGHYGVW